MRNRIVRTVLAGAGAALLLAGTIDVAAAGASGDGSRSARDRGEQVGHRRRGRHHGRHWRLTDEQRACLAAQGVTRPVTRPVDDTTAAAWKAAAEACGITWPGRHHDDDSTTTTTAPPTTEPTDPTVPPTEPTEPTVPPTEPTVVPTIQPASASVPADDVPGDDGGAWDRGPGGHGPGGHGGPGGGGRGGRGPGR